MLLTVFVTAEIAAQNGLYEPATIPEIRIYFKQCNWDHILDSLHQYAGEDGRLAGDIRINGKLYKDVGVRYKGYSSYDPDARKSPFNIDLEYIHKNQNHQGYTRLKLSNVIQDPSFVREVLSYGIAAEYMPASMANFANVFVNDTLMGLYTNVEAVDKYFTCRHFASRNHSFFKGAPSYLTIPDGQNANLFYHGQETYSYYPYYKIESDDPVKNWLELKSLIDVLNNDTSLIDSVLNVDATLWMHAINYTLVNLDSYIGYAQNYYLYLCDDGRFHPIMWDFNMSFGSFRETDGINAPPSGLSITRRKALDPLGMLKSSPLSPRPLITNLLSNSTRRKMFLAHMRTIVDENIRNGAYLVRGQELQSMIDSFVMNDTLKFYPYDQFHLNLDTTVGSGNNVFPGIRDLMEARVAFLDTLTGFSGNPEVSEVSCLPLSPLKGQEITILAKVSGASSVLLYNRNRSNSRFLSAEMYDDGLHGDGLSGDSIYGAVLVCTGNTFQYYIWAENEVAGVFSPQRAARLYYSVQPLAAGGDLVINEVVPETVQDRNTPESGSGWIELCNNTAEEFNLNGYLLFAELSGIQSWTFPDTVIPAHNYLVVDVNSLETGSKMNTGWNLSTREGKLRLFNPAGHILDSAAWNNLSSGISWGRYPNAYGEFYPLSPTYAAVNAFPMLMNQGILIFPNPASDVVFFEVLSPGEIVNIEIFNQNGQRVFCDGIPAGEKNGHVLYQYPTAVLGRGVFLVRIQTREFNFMSAKFFIL